MAFARLFPIDAIDAQDGDRSSSEPSLWDGSCGSPAPQFNAAFSTHRSHRRYWTSGPYLRGRWPSRVVPTASVNAPELELALIAGLSGASATAMPDRARCAGRRRWPAGDETRPTSDASPRASVALRVRGLRAAFPSGAPRAALPRHNGERAPDGPVQRAAAATNHRFAPKIHAADRRRGT